MSLISPYISPTSRLYLACISPVSRGLRARRPALLKVFDKHPEELIRIGRAPDLRLMLDANKELKAALDKKSHVRELLESNPDLDRNRLNELVFSDAQLKDLYDSRPELKVRVRVRVRVNLTLSLGLGLGLP